MKRETFIEKSTRIAGVVSLYWFVSISLVFLNKYLLSSKHMKLDAPLFITWFQCVVSVFLCGIFSCLTKFVPAIISFPDFKINIRTSREVLPLSIIFVSMIASNNLCLKYVGVAFYYVGRSLTTVFNVILSYLILKQSTSLRAVACCAIIVSGFFLGVDQEGVSGSLSITGVLFGVSASVFVALYAIYTKRTLPAVDDNIWRLTLYVNFNALFLFLPLMVFTGEITNLIVFIDELTRISFWALLSLSGVFGFAISYVTGLQIKTTSPLTHNISGTAKACAQTIMACIVFSEVKPMLWWCSNLIVLGGSAAYTQVKRQEMKIEHEKQSSIETDEDDVEQTSGSSKDLLSLSQRNNGSR